MGNQATALRPEVLADLTETTAFSPEVIRQYYRSFIRECDSTRMSIDLDKFKHLYTELFPEGDSAKFAEQVFRVFDADHNGRLDFREFMLALSVQQKGSTEDKLRWLFNMFDLDGTGFISLEELEILIDALRNVYGHCSHEEDAKSLVSAREVAIHIMKKSDTDRDQQLSFQEFIDGSQSSSTMQKLLKGALHASSSPFSRRKKSIQRVRSGTAEGATAL